MPISNEQYRRIYVAALVVSFLLIVGSIYLHLKQKTHLGRMSFHLDRESVQPTSGVEESTTIKIQDYENEDYSDEDIWSSSEEDTEPTISGHSNMSECVHCLCMTVNECRPATCGSGYPCGLFRISNYYWDDAGKPRVRKVSTEQSEDDAYLSCINDHSCATNTVNLYFERYKRDCNKDGVVDCSDLVALHLLGPGGCLTHNISHIHENRLKKCLNINTVTYLNLTDEREEDVRVATEGEEESEDEIEWDEENEYEDLHT